MGVSNKFFDTPIFIRSCITRGISRLAKPEKVEFTRRK